MRQQILAIVSVPHPTLRLESTDPILDNGLYFSTLPDGSLKMMLRNQQDNSVVTETIAAEELIKMKIDGLDVPLSWVKMNTVIRSQLKTIINRLKIKGHIVDSPYFEKIKAEVDWVIDTDFFEEEFREVLPRINLNKPLHLLISGGHGKAYENGQPSLLCNSTIDIVQKYTGILLREKLRFQTIVLDACESASFVPIFRDLLLSNGVIFCSFLSRIANVGKLIDYINESHINRDVFSAYFATMDYLETRAEAEKMPLPILNEAVYTRVNQTLNCYQLEDRDLALERSNALLGARHDNEDTIIHLGMIEEKLRSKGISTVYNQLNMDTMELNIRMMHDSLIRLSNSTMNYSFLLNTLVSLVLAAALVILACVLLPPLGLIPLSVPVAYTLSGISFASGLTAIGFWGSQVSSQLIPNTLYGVNGVLNDVALTPVK